MSDFYGLVSRSIGHFVWVHGMCTFCSRASRIVVTWNFSRGNILQINKLDLIIQFSHDFGPWMHSQVSKGHFNIKFGSVWWIVLKLRTLFRLYLDSFLIFQTLYGTKLEFLISVLLCLNPVWTKSRHPEPCLGKAKPRHRPRQNNQDPDQIMTKTKTISLSELCQDLV